MQQFQKILRTRKKTDNIYRTIFWFLMYTSVSKVSHSLFPPFTRAFLKNTIIAIFPCKRGPTQIRILGPGVPELRSDKQADTQTNKDYNFIYIYR